MASGGFSGQWWNTSSGWARGVLLVALVALAVGLWLAVQWVLNTVGLAGLGWLLAYELGAITSAGLDWRDARLRIGSKWHAWLVGHVTMWHRIGRRLSWLVRLVKVVVAQQRKPLPVVVPALEAAKPTPVARPATTRTAA